MDSADVATGAGFSLKAPFTSSWSYLGARLLLAVVFIWSGVVKLADPSAFAVVIAGYGLLPAGLVGPVALLLPAFELAVGLGIVFDRRGSLGAILGMTLLFLFVLGYGMYLGLDVDCGCYGPADPEAEAYQGLREAFVRDLGLLTVIAYAYWYRRAAGRVPHPSK